MSDDTRTRVLNAAGPVFARKGFRAATVREICSAAGVNLASVNYHFGDKERLYIETVRRAREIRANQFPLPDLGPGTPAPQRLYGFIHTLLQRMIGGDQEPWETQLMVREILQPTKACQQLVEEYFRPHFSKLTDIIAEMMPDETPKHVLQRIAFGVVGQCFYYRVAGRVVSMIVPESEREQHYTVDRLADHITRTTLAALGCESPLSESAAEKRESAGSLA